MQAREFQSPSLKLIAERLSAGGRHLVLDLGPAVGENIRFFSDLACKLYIADLSESLFSGRSRHTESTHAFERHLERDLPSTDGQAVDLILAWDLLNYLERDQLPALARVLTAYCHRGTQLFLMVATLKEMAARPSAYSILGPETLAFRPDDQWQRPAPRYNEPELVRGLPDFQVEVSFLLRNGIQEYVLNYRPGGGAQPPP